MAMKHRRAFQSSLVLALTLVAVPALAQQVAPSVERPSAPLDGGYQYVFLDDLLNAPGFDPNDVQIRVLRHPMRTALLRLRTSFVSEMLTSVEKL